MAALKSFLSRFIAGSGTHQLGMHAAALAYYAVFSIFPLSLLIFAGLTYFLPEGTLEEGLATLIAIFPRLAELLALQAERIEAARNAFGLIGLVGLFYGASGYFGNLSFAIQRIFDADQVRPFWLQRGLGIVLVTLVGVLLLVVVFLSFLVGAVAQLPFVPVAVATILGNRANSAITFAAGALAIFLLFRFTPRRRPGVRPTLLGALATMLALTALSVGFNWYLNSPFARFNLFYGSIGTLMALILLLNLANLVIVHGALLTALLEEWRIDQSIRRLSR